MVGYACYIRDSAGAVIHVPFHADQHVYDLALISVRAAQTIV
jgi:hypothetical protein